MPFGERSRLITELMKKADITFAPSQHVITGSQLRDTGIMRLQFEGAAKCGKSRNMLDVIRHMHEVMKLEIDEILLCIIDFDKDGLHSLLESETLQRKYHDCIRYWKIDLSKHPQLEAYAALDHFEDLLEKHRKKTGFMGVMGTENIGTAWAECQSDYCKIIYKKSIVELLIESKVEAERKGKATLPALSQLHDYKIINPYWLNFANALTMGNYHLIWTCYQYEREVEEHGGKKTKRICGQGQKDNDGKVDWIVTLYRETGNYYATFRGVRGISGNVKIKRPNFTKIVRSIYEIMESEIARKYKKRSLGDPPELNPYWLSERAESPIPTSLDDGKLSHRKTSTESLVEKSMSDARKFTENIKKEKRDEAEDENWEISLD